MSMVVHETYQVRSLHGILICASSGYFLGRFQPFVKLRKNAEWLPEVSTGTPGILDIFLLLFRLKKLPG